MTDSPIIQIKSGKVQGFVSKAEDISAIPVNNFLSIPYGKPPTGTRRFMPPERCDPWEGIKDATKTLVCPMQNNGVSGIYEEYAPTKNTLKHSFQNQTEDCLQLSVFAPCDKSREKIPVLLWICGGAFTRGYAGRCDAVALSGMNNVVVVSPNYRVNALGFLSLGPGSICPGNNALRDIVLALEWVKENIEFFGGDPKNVTIFGESAGAILAQSLMYTSKTRGLFHKAICCSGSCLSIAFTKDLSAVRQKFLQKLEITETEPEKIIKTLQEVPIEKILKVQEEFVDPHSFYPTVDGYLFSTVPSETSPFEHHDIPYLVGVSDSEGGCIQSLFIPNFLNGFSKEEVTEILKEIFQATMGLKDPLPAVNLILSTFDTIAADDDKYKFSKIYAALYANYVFVVPVVMSATIHAKIVKSPTYLYLLTKQLEMNHSETNGPGIRNKLDFVNSDHGDICNLLWGVPFIKGELPGGAWYTEEEIGLSRTIMTYFCNFARTGNPNHGQPVHVEWPTYDPVTRRHLVLDSDVKIDENLSAEFVKFLGEKLPQFIAESQM